MNTYQKIYKISATLLPSFFLINLFGFDGFLGVLVPTVNTSTVFCRTTDFPVLMYHHIRDYSDIVDPVAKNLSVSPDEFRSHLQYLEQNRYTVITTKDIKKGTVPCKSVMLTFDDGYKNVYQKALPIMQEYNYPGVASVIIATMDERWYMTGDEIRALRENWWDIASHTWTHPILTNISLEQIRHEIQWSKKALERWFGGEIQTFVYPGWYYGPETLKITKESWYIYGFSTQFWFARLWSSDTLELKRINMLPWIHPEELENLIEKAKQTTLQ